MLSIVVVSVVLLLLCYIIEIKRQEQFQEGTEYVKSSIDKNVYAVVDPYVIGGDNTKEHAADSLAKINKFIESFIDYLKDKYMDNPILAHSDKTIHVNPRMVTQNLIDRYAGSDVISEHRPDNLSETSYALNKQYIRFCLRNPDDSDAIHKLSILQFVALHEITHLAIDATDHPDQFWETFKFLLKNSDEAGLHIPIDYVNTPIRYCGLKITYNPYYDSSLIG
jgi:hypothetical protein